MTNPIHNRLSIAICDGVDDAVARGFNWAAQPDVRPIEVEQVVVVRGGMESGKASVDFVLRDETGRRFVFMVTRELLRSLPG
ncbi:MAG: hypothetical protein ACTHK2_03850 [Dokdonella sp.]|uniref:hypothetical protein n=1 Tax=Dokdonella sp. TaxID=2291710 RepID=UPI003F7FD807